MRQTATTRARPRRRRAGTGLAGQVSLVRSSRKSCCITRTGGSRRRRSCARSGSASPTEQVSLCPSTRCFGDALVSAGLSHVAPSSLQPLRTPLTDQIAIRLSRPIAGAKVQRAKKKQELELLRTELEAKGASSSHRLLKIFR